MREIIKIPAWLENLNYIASDNLNYFLNNLATIKNRKIDIKYLRKFYKQNNQKKFRNLVDELAFRGFEFASQSNVLPKLSYSEDEDFLFVKEDKARYKKIDYSFLGLNNLIERFNITSDLFFNFIPISGFNYLNKSITRANLINQFANLNFNIVEDTTNFQMQLSLDNQENLKKSRPKNNKKSAINIDKGREKKIAQVFRGRKHKSFRFFCKENGLVYLNDITAEDIERFKHKNGVGKKKYNSVKEKLLDLDKIAKTNIRFYFAPRKYKMFKDFCKEKNINDINEINKKVLLEFKNTKGVGEKRFNDVKLKLAQQQIQYFENNQLTFPALDIKRLFSSQNKLFKEFCEDNGITTINEINMDVLKQFRNKRGVGEKKFNDIKLKIGELALFNAEMKEEINADKKRFKVAKLKFELIKDLKLDYVLEVFNIGYSVDYELKIRDIADKTFIEIEELGLPIEYLKILIREIESFVMPQELMDYLNFSDRAEKIFKLRYGDDYTLEEIGNEFDLSRERARQILSNKVIKKFNNEYTIQNIKRGLRLKFPNKNKFSVQNLITYLGQENIALINLLVSDKVEVFYNFEPLSLYCLDSFDSLETEIERFITNLPEQFKLENYIDEILYYLEKLGVDDPSIDEIEDLLGYYDYKIQGEFFIYKKLTVQQALELIFINYLEEPFRVDEEGFKEIKKIAKEYLDYEFTSNNYRSITGRIKDSDKIILVGKRTFLALEKIDFNFSIIDKIEKFLHNLKAERDVINSQEVFERFEAQLKKNDIKNKICLYSLLKFYLGDEFEIGKKNTLNIYLNSDYSKYTREDILLKIIKENNEVVSKDKILAKPTWDSTKLEDTLAKSNKVITWGRKEITLVKNLAFQPEDKEKLYNFLDKVMEDGYVTSNYLYIEMKFDKQLNELLQKNKIDDSNKLAAFIKTIFPDIKGHTNFLYQKTSEYSSIYDVIKDKFEGVIYRSDIYDFLDDLEYKGVSKNHVINQLIDRGDFVELSRDELIPASQFNLDEKIIKQVCEFVKKRMGDSLYLSLNQLVGYRSELPDIEYTWTPKLIKVAACRGDFREIKKRISDYRYDKLIIVAADSQIKTFIDLIYYMLKHEYDGNMHRLKVHDFLNEQGVLRESSSFHKKKLPYEIRSSPKFKYTARGRIELVGE